MKRIISLFCILTACLSLAACGENSTQARANTEDVASADSPQQANPSKALEEIYTAIDIRDVSKGTKEILNDKFFIAPDLVEEAHFNYTSGRFGVSDVFILKPAKDQMSQVKELLQQVKAIRVKEFSNYDIYNSKTIAEEALVYEQGEYVILLMLEDTDTAKEIINKYIPVS